VQVKATIRANKHDIDAPHKITRPSPHSIITAQPHNASCPSCLRGEIFFENYPLLRSRL